MGQILAATSNTDILRPFVEPFSRRGFTLTIVDDDARAMEHARSAPPDAIAFDAVDRLSAARAADRWLSGFKEDPPPLIAVATLESVPPTDATTDRIAAVVYPQLGFDACFGVFSAVIEAYWLRRRVVEMGKLALLGEMMAGILHELKNPINNLLGGLERISQRMDADPAAARWAELIRRNGELLRESVGNLLAGFRNQLPPQPVNVHETLDKAAHYALKGDVSMRNISLVREYSATNAVVYAAPGPLLHLFLNLLLNARQAIGPAPGSIVVRSANEDHSLLVEVRDSGPGIDPGMFGRLFERFQTTKKSGSGVGLVLVRSVAEQLGGQVSAANHPDGGAVFRVMLPLPPQPPASLA